MRFELRHQHNIIVLIGLKGQLFNIEELKDDVKCSAQDMQTADKIFSHPSLFSVVSYFVLETDDILAACVVNLVILMPGC